MTDVSTLVVLTAPLVIVAVFDWYVARRFISAARKRPHITILTSGAFVRVGIAIGATLSVILAIASVWLLLTGQRVIPQPWGVVILYAICIVPSLANLSSFNVLRQAVGPDQAGDQ